MSCSQSACSYQYAYTPWVCLSLSSLFFSF
jgi:hypothetical protein